MSTGKDAGLSQATALGRGAQRYVAVLALGAAVVLALAGASWSQAGTWSPLVGLLAVVAIVATGFAPLSTADHIDHAGAYLDSAVLIALAMLLPPGETIVVYAIGQAASHLALRSRLTNALLNLSFATMAAGAAVVVFGATRGASGSWNEVASALLAGLLYAAVTWAAMWPWQRCTAGITFKRFASPQLVHVLLTEAVVIDSLGFIAAVLARWSPWGLVLMACPIALLSWTSRGLLRVQGDRIRMEELVVAGDDAQAAEDRAAVIRVMLQRAPRMLRCETVEFRDCPPGEHEIGAPLDLSDTPAWIVAHRRQRQHAYSEQDGQALRALVRIVQSALASRDHLDSVSHRALHDALTGLANRAFFAETLAAEVRRCRRTGERFALIYLDLDDFKPVNDEHGHDAGDAVLVEIAQRLAAAARGADTVARVGGDEFCVLAPGVASVEEGLDMAHRLCLALDIPHSLPGGAVRVGASVGVAIGPEAAEESEDVVRRADRAMYRAKQSGSGPVPARSFAGPPGDTN